MQTENFRNRRVVIQAPHRFPFTALVIIDGPVFCLVRLRRSVSLIRRDWIKKALRDGDAG
jgi:hypothetical protein